MDRPMRNVCRGCARSDSEARRASRARLRAEAAFGDALADRGERCAAAEELALTSPADQLVLHCLEERADLGG
jgi:hypothetical protein